MYPYHIGIAWLICGCNWPSCSWEIMKNVVYWQTDDRRSEKLYQHPDLRSQLTTNMKGTFNCLSARYTLRYPTTDDMRSEKLTWAYSSGYKKTGKFFILISQGKWFLMSVIYKSRIQQKRKEFQKLWSFCYPFYHHSDFFSEYYWI